MFPQSALCTREAILEAFGVPHLMFNDVKPHGPHRGGSWAACSKVTSNTGDVVIVSKNTIGLVNN